MKPNSLPNFEYIELVHGIEIWGGPLFILILFFGFRMLGEIGLKNTEFLSDIVPVLIDLLDDDTPAVVRQALLCGIDLFRATLEKIAVQVSVLFWMVSALLLCDKIGDECSCGVTSYSWFWLS